MARASVRVPPFTVRWPVIGMVHLRPLPGSPGYGGAFEPVIERARREIDALQAGGVDGLMFENFGDAPFDPGSAAPEVVAAITRVIEAVRDRLRLPFGVNVLRNDARSALGIAAVTGAAFLRVNVHVGAMVTDQGLLMGRAHETLRERARLAPWVKIWADCGVKHAAPLAPRPLVHEVEDMVERGLADAVILTGPATGHRVADAALAEVKAALPRVPLLAGSGVTAANLPALFPHADGAIVGTAFKTRGVVERARVAAFVRAVRDRRAGSRRS